MKMAEESSPYKIMIVDDTPANLKLLNEMLQENHYSVYAFPKGELALQAAPIVLPDLILLDINMPGMNGYEVCEHLKKERRLAEIPVIFISALNETQDKVKGFSVGGVDYITKPFQLPEVLMRVHTHLELHRQKIELRENYKKLQELERYRDDMVHMIAHDMRSPLTGIIGSMELMRLKMQATLSEDNLKTLIQSITFSRMLNEMVSSFLDVSRLEDGNFPLNRQRADLGKIIQASLDSITGLLINRKIVCPIFSDPVFVYCDEEITRRILVNLIANALKYTPNDKEVHIEHEVCSSEVKISVIDQGSGIPAEFQEKIFEKFFQVDKENRKIHYSTGLGLTFCKKAVNAQGGEISVRSESQKGAIFTFSLPLRPAS